MELPTLLINILESFMPTITMLIVILIKRFCYKKRSKKSYAFNNIMVVLALLLMFTYFYILNIHENSNMIIYTLMTVTYYIGMTNILTLNKKGQVFYTIRAEQLDENGKKIYTTITDILVPFSKVITFKARVYVSEKTGYELLKGSIYKLKMGEFIK